MAGKAQSATVPLPVATFRQCDFTRSTSELPTIRLLSNETRWAAGGSLRFKLVDLAGLW